MSKKYISVAVLLALLAFAAPVQAHESEHAAVVELSQQEQVAKGTVVDKKTGSTIVGASVVEKGTTNGVATDMEGNFALQVNEGAVLQISFFGYQTVEVAAGSELVVELVEDVQSLDEVVVVGYGVQKKATVTGAVSSVKGKDLKVAGNSNITNTFAGKLPGVIATNRSGEPGNDYSTLLIRGKGTLNDCSPLVVIDGVANRGGLERLNPNDIESINVLKDASAAIYGAQAANGVILVTTKRGSSANKKPVITYDGSVTLSQNTRTPKLLNAYEYMVWADEISTYRGQTPLFENIKGGYLDGTINRDQYGDTDWMDVVFSKVALQTRHSLSVSGATEKVKYYVSGDYSYQQPQYRNTVFNYQTAQIRSNIDANITDNFKIGVDLAGRQENRHNSPYSTGTIFWEAFMAYPYLYDYYPNGLPGPGLANGNNLAILVKGKDTGYDKVNDYFLDSKFSFDLKMPWITQGLSLSGYAAFDFHFRNEKILNDVWDTYDYNTDTKSYDKKTTNMNGNQITLKQSHDHNISKTLHFKLNYDRVFGDHHVGAFVAYEQNRYDGEQFWGWRGFYLTSQRDYLDFGGDKDKTNGGSGYVSARQNIFGRLNYSYKERYMFEFTVRHDGSMNFAPNHRWGTFPSVSVAWRLSEENFIRDHAEFINDLKLRASWGKLGNDRVSPFQYLDSYEMQNGAVLGDTPGMNAGIVAGKVGNPNITWEKVDSKNIALDGMFWDGKLGFTLEYFHQNRKDILTPKQASVPSYSGLSLPDQNIGEVNNQGVEIMLSHRSHIGSVNYFVSGNFTYTKNKIVYFDEAANIPQWQRRTGGSLDTWLMYKTDGIYQTQAEVDSTPHLPGAQPGDIKYVDIDGDGSITSNDRIRSEYGNIPRIVYGLSLGLEWKGLSFSMMFTGQGQASQMIVPYSYNTYKDFYDHRWISAEKIPHATFPRAFNKDDKINTKWSDFWLYNASFLRLKNVELSYTLPSRLTRKLGLNNVRLTLAGNNLFTVDHIKFQDPESDATSTGQYYPQARTYSFGVSLSF